MRIAIIGSGISGLVAAHRLHPGHDITVFEADRRIGGHTHTIDVEADGRRLAVDTGFIVYNERNYPHFSRLLRELGVPSHPTTMSFSVTCRKTGLEYNGTSINRLFAQRRNLFRPSFLRMIRDIFRFNRAAASVLQEEDERSTVGQFVREKGYSAEFVEHYLVPLGASLWSCPADTFREFPIRFLVRFLANHGMTTVYGHPQWRVISGGSQRYVDRLTRPFRDRILTGTPVRSVRRRPTHVEVVAGDEGPVAFDHVVFSCHSDQALRILGDATERERELLGSFPYQRNEAFLHTDTRILPRTRAAWASWNYHIPREPRDRVTVTYNMNMLQGLVADRVFCVTLNDGSHLDPDLILRRIVYHHPIFSWRGARAQARHHELVDRDRTSFCGAYWGNGFHEDGVRSALAVCRALLREKVS